MADTTYMVQVILPYDTGGAGDIAVNSYHFRCGIGTTRADDILSINSEIADFYGALQPGGGRVAALLSPVINGGACRVKITDLEDPRPRIPINQADMNISPVGGTVGLPPQVTAIVEWRKQPLSGDNPKRQRNWTNIGPLCADVVLEQEAGTNRTILEDDAFLTLSQAIDKLISDGLVGGPQLVAFSPTTAGPDTQAAPWTPAEIAAASFVADQYRIDRQFHIQGRRLEEEAAGAWTSI